MNSEKVKEIKKVLEMFAIDNKEMTLFQSPVPQGESCVKTIKYADILTLINKLESENETIRLNMQETEKASFNINQMNGNLVIENQKLKDRIAELEKENTIRQKLIDDFSEENERLYDNIHKKQLPLKQFAERLFEKYSYDKLTHEPDEDIEIHLTASELYETLKEFIGERL